MMKTLPAYVIGQLSVKDYEEYVATYGAGVFEQIKAAGAEVLVAAPDVQVLEGEWHGNWTIVVKYPSMDAALDSYNAPEYEPLKQLRYKLTEPGNLVVAPGTEWGASTI